MKRSHAITLVAIASVGSLAAQQLSPAPSIQGVWKVIEETNNFRTITNPSPGYIIYTAKHFAVVREAQDIKRPDVADVDKATAEQLLAMWGPFAAQFGTYAIQGDRMTMKILVAKNPSQVNNESVRRVRIQGNILVTEPYAGPDGKPLAKPIGLKMIRIE
jgi:hypothetical protein